MPATPRPGPPLEALLHRLLETPGDFLRPPRVERRGKTSGTLHVDALVCDTLRALGGQPLDLDASRPLRTAADKSERNALQLVALACWLLHDPWFAGKELLAPAAETLLLEGFLELAELVEASHCVTDPDRREELARRVLAGLGLHPEGETPTTARDRLTALDSVERMRVARAAMEAERRAREIRERAARSAAEAASYYGRE